MVTYSEVESLIGNRVISGYPQSGVSSPLLRYLVLDEPLDGIEGQGSITKAYADELVIIVRDE